MWNNPPKINCSASELQIKQQTTDTNTTHTQPHTYSATCTYLQQKYKQHTNANTNKQINIGNEMLVNKQQQMTYQLHITDRYIHTKTHTHSNAVGCMTNSKFNWITRLAA